MTASVSPERPRRLAATHKPGKRRVNGAAEEASLRQIPIDRIQVPGQPARRFLGDIAALAGSMQDYGLQQPISVRLEGDQYMLTSGMRRLAAARKLRWTTITAFVLSVSADDAYLLDLVENLQREDLSAEEEAEAFRQLIRTRGWSVHQVADSVKRSAAYISKRVRVFEDPLLREAIATGDLPISTAEVLLAAGPEERAGLVERASTEGWDQMQARNALRPPDADLDSFSRHETHTATSARRAVSRRSSPSAPTALRGFTRMVREFHRVLIGVRAEDLRESDRAALRALFRDLVLLARAPSTPAPRVFPPLPRARSRRTPRSRS